MSARLPRGEVQALARPAGGSMRICHVITGLNDGGAEAVLYRLCVALKRADPTLQQTVVSLRGPGKYGPMLAAAGIEVVTLSLRRATALGGLWRLVGLLRRTRPDIVQTWMYHANLIGGVAARLAGLRNIVWNIRQSGLDPRTTRITTRLVDWLCARLSSTLPRVIVSCSARAAFDHAALGYDGDRVVVIPNGFELGRFAPDPTARQRVRAEFGVPPETMLLGLVGRWHKIKDHPNLLAALSRLGDGAGPWRLLLVGTNIDAQNRELVEAIAANGLADRVILAGRRDDVPAIMNALDLHVLSSSSEAFPNVVAEAMASGTPCVVTDVGDAAMIVDDTGWVVPPRDPAELAAAIETAASAFRDPAHWHARRDAARQRIVDEFGLDLMVERYRSVWVPPAPRT